MKTRYFYGFYTSWMLLDYLLVGRRESNIFYNYFELLTYLSSSFSSIPPNIPPCCIFAIRDFILVKSLIGFIFD